MSSKKVMIVEDEVIVGMDLEKKIQDLGYIAGDTVLRYGEDVLEAAERLKPDLILMDIHLKGNMDGTQVAEEVKQKLGIPVIFLTAYSDKTTLEKAKIANPYAYLKKPVGLEDLKISLELTAYRAEMQKKLTESELRFRTVADNTYDWETWTHPDGYYLYVSPSCERYSGYPSSVFMENHDFIYSIIHENDFERVKKEFAIHCKFEKGDCHTTFRIISSDGKKRWIEHFCRPVFDSTGRYIGRRGSNREITQRKELELLLEKKVTELQEALDNIKTLEGMLPICAQCKKIRDDQGYWNMIEEYIQNHTNVTFSHGMCPSCMDEMYGDEDWYNEK